MTTQVGALDLSYVSLINSIMAVEKQPLTRLTTQLDSINVQKGVYTDLSSMLTSFQTSVKGLISTEAFYSLQAGRTSSVAPTTSDLTVLTATTGSSSVPGQYDVSVTTLAKAHRVRSNAVEYSNQPLNMTGSFVIGGAEARSLANVSAASGITAFDTGEVASGEKELASDTYYVETRQSGDQWEFRLVNKDGEAVSIMDQDSSEDYISDWQGVPTDGGTIDTGRGMTFELDSRPRTIFGHQPPEQRRARGLHRQRRHHRRGRR